MSLCLWLDNTHMRMIIFCFFWSIFTRKIAHFLKRSRWVETKFRIWCVHTCKSCWFLAARKSKILFPPIFGSGSYKVLEKPNQCNNNSLRFSLAFSRSYNFIFSGLYSLHLILFVSSILPFPFLPSVKHLALVLYIQLLILWWKRLGKNF